ncbi:MAG: histidine phosphatase family protein [Massiliimalia sp.]|jgi:uncharacterized phosphatase
MAIFYLIRHGKTDYSERNKKIYQGFGVNLSPLSADGIKEIKNTAKDKRLCEANIILSSPYTRAVQTAAILSKELQIDLTIETDLHEWMANKNYIYEDDKTAEKSYHEFVQLKGVYPDDADMDWEDMSAMRKRILPILEKYKHYEKIIVACHGMIIQSLVDGYHPKNGEIVEFEL